MKNQLSVAVLQSDICWHEPSKNREIFEKQITSIESAIDLIILPEMFTTGFTMEAARFFETMSGETINWMKKMAIEKEAAITGSIIIKENNEYFNRLIWIHKGGTLHYYDKKHLFSLADEHLNYTPGVEPLIVDLEGWKIRPAVCYDLRFPVWLRNSYDQQKKEYEYDLLLVVANWPTKRIGAWKTLLQARAIENQAYVVGVNRVGTDGNNHHYSGESAVYNELGETIYSKADIADIGVITLNKETLINTRNHLPFLADGDAFTIH
jgi:predicted amidohydrolase